MELDELHNLLALLRDYGVNHYSDDRVTLTLGPKELPILPVSQATTSAGGSMWDDPRLWPGGSPPKFPNGNR